MTLGRDVQAQAFAFSHVRMTKSHLAKARFLADGGLWPSGHVLEVRANPVFGPASDRSFFGSTDALRAELSIFSRTCRVYRCARSPGAKLLSCCVRASKRSVRAFALWIPQSDPTRERTCLHDNASYGLGQFDVDRFSSLLAASSIQATKEDCNLAMATRMDLSPGSRGC